MKKLLSIVLLFTAHLSYNAAIIKLHDPAKGPLPLADTKTMNGVVTQALVNPDLSQEAAIIAKFTSTTPNAKTYQDIITAIKNSPGNKNAIEALKAYEKIIMYLYQHEACLLHIKYHPYLSMTLPNCIRRSWANPFKWLSPKSWISDNNKKLEQLIEELDQLADVAYVHSSPLYLRMKGVVLSYEKWRAAIMATVIAFLFWEAYTFGDSSSLAMLGDHALQGATAVGQGAMNLGEYGLELGSQAAQGAWDATTDAVSSAASSAGEGISNLWSNTW